MARKILFTDIDNTLYNWPAFFAPSFRAMVYALVRELRIPEEQLYAEFKEVFARHGSLEYAFAIQELESVRCLGTDEVRHLIRQGRGAFLSVQRRRLRPYPGVPETLKWLLEQDIAVVGVTNSPIWRAQQRLFDLKLDSLLTGLVAWEGFDPPPDPATAGFVRASRKRDQTRVRRSVAVPLAACKPNEKHYAIALQEFGGDPAEAWVVGDSLAKDLEPAAKLGVSTVWARYGAGFDPDDRDEATLLRITHWSESEITHTYSTEVFDPEIAIDSFAELKKILPTAVLTLF